MAHVTHRLEICLGVPFAGNEPNTAGGTEDLGGGFDLVAAAGRAGRTRSVLGNSDQGTASS